MKNDRWLVRWQDGTYDWSRKCDECQSPTCSYPTHTDRYKEIGTTESPAKDYWDWMALVNPLGCEVNGLGEPIFNEYFDANPDGLPGIEGRTSGTSQIQYQIMQEAFDQLTPKQQEVWTLVMREQVSQTDAATKLGVTRETLKTHLSRAKLKFTDYLRSQSSRVSD